MFIARALSSVRMWPQTLLLSGSIPGIALRTACGQRSFSSSSFLTASLARKPTKIKLKTHKGAAKRWTALTGGMFKRAKTGRVHLNSHMSPNRLNRLGQPAYARPSERKTLRRLLPYSQ